MKEFTIALVGNPNVGKTSLYNQMTSSHAHVGNWHGVTVDEAEKVIFYAGNKLKIVDLPGLYSLNVYSKEEEISRNFLLNNECDVVVCVADAGNLTRNLYLCLQLIEHRFRVILAVNMMDEIEKQGKTLDDVKLANSLGMGVVPLSSHNPESVNKLLECIGNFVLSPIKPALPEYVAALVNTAPEIVKKRARVLRLKPYEIIRALEGDKKILAMLALSDTEFVNKSCEKVAALRYNFIDKITFGIVVKNKNNGKMAKNPLSMSVIDRVVLNKYAALPVFFVIMAAIFFITFGLGGYLSTFISGKIFSVLSDWVAAHLSSFPIWISALICDGVISGVGGVLAFLPQIVLLFFLLALIEDSGYVSRVAFMSDGLFRKFGLSGRAVFTMLMGFGCSATAVLTARGLEDVNMRKKAVLLTPFMSCSARLPVYAAVASAFFIQGKTLIIFGLYMLGIVVAFAFAAVTEKTRLKSKQMSFVMEIPPYRLPSFRRIWSILSNNIKTFIVKIGSVVFVLNVIVWILCNFSLTSGYSLGSDDSIMATFCRLFAFVFTPLGFGNWKAVASLLSGIVAKEGVISCIESLGGIGAVIPDSSAAAAFLAFTLLYVPCAATLGAIKKEIGTKWMFFSLIMQFSVAYIMALIVHAIFYLDKLGFFVAIALSGVIIYCIARLMKDKCGRKYNERRKVYD